MKNLLRALLLLLILSPVFLVAQSPKTLADIKNFERTRYAAIVAGDLPALEKMLAPELIYTHSNAAVENRQEYLDAFRTGKYRFRAFSTDSTEYRFLKKKVVVAAGIARIHGFRFEKEFDFTARFTAVYVKRQRRWQLLAWQTTRR